MQIDQEFTDALMATDEGKKLADACLSVRASTAEPGVEEDESGRPYLVCSRTLWVDTPRGLVFGRSLVDARLHTSSASVDIEASECSALMSVMAEQALGA